MITADRPGCECVDCGGVHCAAIPTCSSVCAGHPPCCKCGAVDAPEEHDGDQFCTRCYNALPEQDDSYAGLA